MRLALIAAALTACSSAAFAEQPAPIAANVDLGSRHVVVCDRLAAASSWARECASGASGAAESSKAAHVARQVFVCDRTADTRRAWIREYGEMTFVTADELARAEASNEGWAAPRCITNGEMRRFTLNYPEGEKMARAIKVVSNY